jgi:CBS domain-containing protein
MTLPPALQNAAAHPVRLTVRELLGLFGMRNRDFESVGLIEGELTAAGLCCTPPFTEDTLASTVTVRAVAWTAPDTQEAGADEDIPSPAVASRVGDIPSARLGDELIVLSPDDGLEHARTLMLAGNFSQLPVLDGPIVLKGAVSWQSIATAHARGQCEKLSDATDPEQDVVRIEADLLGAIPAICREGHVFVRDEQNRVSGIVTASDLAEAFGDLTGPFLRLGELERRLRQCVERMCPTVDELRDVTGHKKATAAHDLTVSQIEKVFRDPARWKMLKWGISQDYFVKELEGIRREIRNAVAHFRPHPLTPEQRHRLDKFAGMVKSLQP